MYFTKKEIELAKQLKEALEWKSEEGDWYFGEDGEIIFYTGAYDVIRRKDTWLPLWHQCREILRCNGYLVEMSESMQSVILRVMKDGKQYSFCGETDLEVMYKALLSPTIRRIDGNMQKTTWKDVNLGNVDEMESQWSLK